MHELSRWQRWMVLIVTLPVAAMLSTFTITQTQIGRLVPNDLPNQATLWSILQLCLASSIVWLVWRNHAQQRNWSVIGTAIIEAVGLFGVALSIGWYLALIDLTWMITSERVIAFMALAIPLAWWSYAEEHILRQEIGHLLSRQPALLRDISLLLIGLVVQLSILSVSSVYVIIIVVLTEGLSIITWAGGTDVHRAWARRWAWRWIFVAGAGVSSTGFITGTPSPLVITTDDPFALFITVAAAMAAWISYSGFQQLTKGDTA